MVLLYFVRHAETEMKLGQSTRDWPLTPDGKKRAGFLAKSGFFDSTDLVVTSTEEKAIETGRPLSLELDIEMKQVVEFDELDRGISEVMSQNEYKSRVSTILKDYQDSHFGWESGKDALERFWSGVRKVQELNLNRAIVVSHGLVLTLYFADLLDCLSSAYDRWTHLKFLSWGVVNGRRVLQDIV